MSVKYTLPAEAPQSKVDELNSKIANVDTDFLNNVNCYGTIIGNLKTIVLNTPKNAMTKNTQYDCGAYPSKYASNYSYVVGIHLVGNGREYTLTINNGHVYLTPLSDLPSSGKPALGITYSYM